MFKNYLRIAFRSLLRNPVISAIHIGGLSFGIAAFLLIFQYISFEKSVNGFHTNLSSIYRSVFEGSDGSMYDYSPPVLGPRLAAEIPSVKNYCRVAEGIANGIVSIRKNQAVVTFKETRAAYVDSSFFQIFTFPLEQGALGALTNPNTVSISASTARRYFGSDAAIGKDITLNNEFGENHYVVTAVHADFPENSDLQFDLLLSIQTLANPANLHGSDWANLEGTSSYLTTYLLLVPAVSTDEFTKSANTLIQTLMPDNESMFQVQSLANIHLPTSMADRQPHTGNLGFLYLLVAVALLIVVIAWFNYVNLSTAGALKRAREVGLRKVVGASKVQLVTQFLGESLFLNVVSLLIALAIVNGCQPFFNQLVGKELSLAFLYETSLIWIVLLWLGVGTIASGAYTAFVLASFTPSQTLKGNFARSASGLNLRRILVVFQFAISMMLMAGTFILYSQLQFMRDQNLGMNIDQLVVLRGSRIGVDSTYGFRKQSFLNSIEQAGFVKDYCSSASVPTDGFNYSTSGITRQNPMPGDDKRSYSISYVDNRFFNTYEIPVIAGRSFTRSDCEKPFGQFEYVVLNERAVREMGFTSAEDAVGKKIRWNDAQLEVAGVVKDYHHLSLRSAIDPIVFVPQLTSAFYSIRLQPGDHQDQLEYLKKNYEAFFPGNPFEYFFADDNYNRQYETEQKYGMIFSLSSGLAIFIACLGLLGLAIFTVEQRTKEMAIRKVLGAGVVQVTQLLSRDFILLVFFALVVATPVTWWVMDQWLNTFAYRIGVNGWLFLASGLIATLITLLTVGSQALRAASVNPAHVLKND